jgi:hypothetical protein
MCSKCDARRVAVISTIAALGQSLAETAKILYDINANKEMALVLDRVREVFDLDPDRVFLDENYDLQAKPNDEQVTDARTEGQTSGSASFAEKLSELLGEMVGDQPKQPEYFFVTPPGATKAEVDYMLGYIAEKQGIAVSDIKVV